MDLWSIRIIVKDKFKELFSEYFENFDGYMSSSLFQDNDCLLYTSDAADES